MEDLEKSRTGTIKIVFYFISQHLREKKIRLCTDQHEKIMSCLNIIRPGKKITFHLALVCKFIIKKMIFTIPKFFKNVEDKGGLFIIMSLGQIFM